MAIRYDKRLNTRIRGIVRNYNAKVRRLSGRVDIDIPPIMDRYSVKLLKQTTKNRADLNRKLKNLQEFTKRGGEQNITVKGRVIPQYKYKQAQRYRKLITRRLNAREQFNKTTRPTYEGKKEESYINEKKKNYKIFVVRILLIATSLGLIIHGIINGGASDVLQKAINICTECIGLG